MFHIEDLEFVQAETGVYLAWPVFGGAIKVRPCGDQWEYVFDGFVTGSYDSAAQAMTACNRKHKRKIADWVTIEIETPPEKVNGQNEKHFLTADDPRGWYFYQWTNEDDFQERVGYWNGAMLIERRSTEDMSKCSHFTSMTWKAAQ